MGYQLRRALRDALGPEITGLQRAVALEIADDANDDSRRSWASLDDLARWTGAKDEDVVRNALKRLAAAGWEFRVPLGVGKDGRKVFAVPGRRLTFQVPPFEGVAGATPVEPKGEPRLLGNEPPLPLGGATAPSVGAVAPPFSSAPQLIPSTSPPAARARERDDPQRADRHEAAGGGDEDLHPEAKGIAERLPYPQRVPGRGQRARLMTALSQALRTGWPPDDLYGQLTRAMHDAKDEYACYMQRLADLPAWTGPAAGTGLPEVAPCGDCDPTYRQREYASGVGKCCVCHPSYLRRAAAEPEPAGFRPHRNNNPLAYAGKNGLDGPAEHELAADVREEAYRHYATIRLPYTPIDEVGMDIARSRLKVWRAAGESRSYRE